VARIIDCVNANNSLLFVGYIYLYNNFLDIIKDNLYKIGPINSIEFMGYNQKPRIDSSLFWDWLPHDLTIYNKLFDVMPNLVAAKNIILNDQILDAEAIFNNNGHIIISRLSSQRQAKRSMTFEGQKGQIQFDDGQRFLKIDLDDEKMQFDSLSYIPPLRTELAEFISAIQYRDKDIQFNVARTLEDSMKIADLIERAENLAKSF